MTDTTDDRRRPPRGRSDRPRASRPRPERTDAEQARDAPDPSAAGLEEPEEERIAKAIARAGVASRRDAEAMIADGRVTLNGEVLASPAVNVTPQDRITVDGEPLPRRERTRLWIYHKPRGLVTTARDPQGRPTVFENLPEDLPRVVAVGRLDMNTEGLLLLTNDGGLAKVIAHPDTGWMRRYRVRAHGDITQADLDRLRGGITIDEMEYGSVEATLDRVQGDNVWITMGLREGKNREIKRILEHLGLQVNRLIRLSFGPFQLGDLEPGLVEEVRTKVLKDQLGKTLADEAGVDFESPVREPIQPFGSPKAPADARRSAPRDERRPPRGFARDDEYGRDRAPAGRRAPGALDRHRPSVWRDEDSDASPRPARARREGDPKAARAAAGERPRQRVGAVAAGARKVVVERLVSRNDEPSRDDARPPRPKRPGGDAPGRGAPGGDDRPRRREQPGGFGEGRPTRRREASEGFRDDRPPRREASGGFGEGRPPRRGPGPGGFRDERPPRRRETSGGFGDDRPRRREGPGGFGEDRAPRPDRASRFGEGRAPRRFGEDGGPARPSRPPREGGPGRKPSSGPPGARPTGGRGPRAPGGGGPGRGGPKGRRP